MIRPYWIIDNNLDKLPGSHSAAHPRKRGLYGVTPAWKGSILYGTNNRFSVTAIRFTSYWNECWVEDPGFTCQVVIGPPNHPDPPHRRATAVARFGPGEGRFWRLLNITVLDGGEGYRTPPSVTLVYSPPPRPAYQFNVRAEIGSGAAGGVTMDRSDHGLAVGDVITFRWVTHDIKVINPGPDNTLVHFNSVVTKVDGASVQFAGGYPQPLMEEDNDDYYVPGDLCDGHTGENILFGMSASPTWSEPLPYDPKLYAPYRNDPPWKLSIYKHDPEPVYFHQDRNGGPLRIGELVAVHEGLRYNGYRICWPISALSRGPHWG